MNNRRFSMNVLIAFIFLFSNIFLLSEDVIAYNDYEKIDGLLVKTLEVQKYVRTSVLLKDNEHKSSLLGSLSEDDFIVSYVPNGSPWFSGYLTKSGLEKIRNNSEIQRIHIPPKAYPQLSESAPLINANDVWSFQINGMNITGEEQIICVVDSGVNKNHPDLDGKVIAEYCYCDCGLFCGCCPNGQDQDSNATDEDGHGTHVAGIVVANGSVKGIAPGANIVAVRVADDNGYAYDDDIAKGIKWCNDNKDSYNISIITISYGTDFLTNDTSICDEFDSSLEVNNAYNSGIFVSVASGNDGSNNTIRVPSCATNATSVGNVYDSDIGDYSWLLANCTDNITFADKIACGSNRASILDLLAPGSKIKSTYIPLYFNLSGTSQSAPHVAGAAALLIQYERLKNNIPLTPAEIEERFKDTGKLIFDDYQSANNASGSNLTFPRIDAYAALFPLDAYNLQTLNSNSTNMIFGFNIQNNYNNKTKNVSWSFDLGNGTIVNSTENVTLSPKEEAFVYFEQDYADGDIYTISVNGSSDSLYDSESMTVAVGDIIAHSIAEIYTNAFQRIFSFTILNNMGVSKLVNWTLDTDENVIDAINLTGLEPDEDVFVYIDYNYSIGGTKDISALATNNTFTDYSNMSTYVSG